MTHRSTASFGKRQEYIAVAKLLHLNFDVYMTLVDDQQIDCIIRLENNGKPRYLDVQIKARSKDAKYGAYFAALTVRKPRRNFWYIFYSEVINTYWVIPSMDVIRLSSVNKGGPDLNSKNKGKLAIKLANRNKDGWKPRPKFRKYENAFHLLNG